MSKNAELFSALKVINGVASSVTGMKVCIGCLRNLPVEDNFYPRENERGMRGQYGSYCKKCLAEKGREKRRL